MARVAKILAGAAVMALALSACSGNNQPSGENTLGTITAGKLTVCTNPPYEPFEYEDPSSPSGYAGLDMDLSAEIADRLGLELVVLEAGFDAIQSGVAMAAGTCDMGASAVTITEDRREGVDFSQPYYDSLQSLLVSNESGITSLNGLAGKKIGVQATTTGETYANENKPEGAEILSFPSDGEMWLALQGGQVDALLQDFPINHMHTEADNNYTVVAKYETDESYGFTFAKDKNPALVAAVDAELQSIREDGTYQTIYDKYFA